MKFVQSCLEQGTPARLVSRETPFLQELSERLQVCCVLKGLGSSALSEMVAVGALSFPVKVQNGHR